MMSAIPNGASNSSLASSASADEVNCVPVEDVSEHFSVLQSTRLNYVPPKPRILQSTHSGALMSW